MKPIKILIIAGEASGDLHGGPLVAALKEQQPDAEIFGIGGYRMKRAGMELHAHVEDLAYIGVVEIVRHLGFFKKLFNRMIELMQSRKPDMVVLIDYPGFNLRFGKKAKELGFPVFYYIAPQVWAWRRGRAKKMAAFIDRMAVIFDFEVPFFAEHGIDTHFVGHPLVDGMKVTTTRDRFFAAAHLDPNRPLLALLPGSRRQEIENLLPNMAAAADRLKQKYPQVQIAVSRADTISRRHLEAVLLDSPHIAVIEHDPYDLMKYATAAVVSSGTATLETAFFGTPFCLVYRVAPFTYTLGKYLVKIPFIGLVNIVAQDQVVNEMIQDKLEPESLAREMERLMFNQTARETIKHGLQRVKDKMGEPGAAQKTADLILDAMSIK